MGIIRLNRYTIHHMAVGICILGLSLFGLLSIARTLTKFNIFATTNHVEFSNLIDSLLPKIKDPARKDIPLFLSALNIDDLLVRKVAFRGLTYFHSPIIHNHLIQLLNGETDRAFLCKIATVLTQSYPDSYTISAYKRLLFCSQPLDFKYLLSAFNLYLITHNTKYLAKITCCIGSQSYTLRFIYLTWFKELNNPSLIPLIRKYYIGSAQLNDSACKTISYIQTHNQTARIK